MIRSSANLESDDVHIRCRVRRSQYASQPDFGDAQEMTCTMRNWHLQKQRSPSVGRALEEVMNSASNTAKPSDATLEMIGEDAHQGPELLLRVIHSSSGSLNGMESSNGRPRKNSFGSSAQPRSKRKVWAERHESPRPQRMAYCIAMSDIVVADVHDALVLFLTTSSHGYFEFSFRTANARDMMVAFLNASLSPERILSQEQEKKPDEALYSFDVEALTANRIEERMRTETLSEKFRRRVTHVAVQIGEMSSALSECACGCGNEPGTPVGDGKWNDDGQRQSPSPPRYQPGNMEFSTQSVDFSTQSVDDIASPKKSTPYMKNLEPELEIAR